MFFFATFLSSVFCCTNLIVTKGASAEGYNTFAYNADGFRLFGGIAARPAADYPEGTLTQIYEMDSGHYLGEIPQATHTYNVVGLMNEFGLALGESTFGGVEILSGQNGALIDYESLLYLTLQRARNVSEAISVIDNLLQTYGYYSDGESFTIGDKNEIWIMEIMSKGNFEKGAVWVARRIPDGCISGHANQARITTFPWDDPENCLYSADVMTFAQTIGLYPADGTQENFDFAAVYNPISFTGARFCDARVWSFFSYALGASTMANFTDYALGRDLTVRMPLYYPIGTNSKISLRQLRDYMGNHYEGLALDTTLDVGAGPFAQPHRWTPNRWSVNGTGYVNERPVGTQQTFFSYVHQIRDNVHPILGGITWIGFDDSSTGCPVPQYSTIPTVHNALTNQSGGELSFTFTSFFWLFNLVGNWANTRYNVIYPEIQAKRESYLQWFDKQIAEADAHATQLANEGLTLDAITYLTDVSYTWAQNLTEGWLDLFKDLFVKYSDGNVKTRTPGQRNPDVAFPGYGDAWYKRIVAETGTRYLEPEESNPNILLKTAAPSSFSSSSLASSKSQSPSPFPSVSTQVSASSPSLSPSVSQPQPNPRSESVRSFLALFDERYEDKGRGKGEDGENGRHTLREPYSKESRLRRLNKLKGI